MQREAEIIQKISSNIYKVTFSRPKGCSHCGACSTKAKPMEVLVNSSLDLEIEDKVLVEITGGSFLKIVFVAYVLPVIILVIGYLIAAIFKFKEILRIVLALLFVISYYLLLYKQQNKQKSQTTIGQILKKL